MAWADTDNPVYSIKINEINPRERRRDAGGLVHSKLVDAPACPQLDVCVPRQLVPQDDLRSDLSFMVQESLGLGLRV